MPKNKHLAYTERLQIEQWLRDRVSIKQIAQKLNKSTSTVSREIRSHATASNKFPPYRIHNRCVKRNDCQKHYLCVNKPSCTKRCSTCSLCNEMCEDYQEQQCYKLFEPPYVCNGCTDEYQCVMQKKYYIHSKAHEAYREMLVESRVGANITEDELLALDEIVSPLVMRGQSVHHIVTHNPDQFEVSEKSIYRYVAGGLLKARNIDMPRVCRIKSRKSKPVEHKVDSGCRIGRTYAEFLAFIETSSLPVVEIDSVIGRIGGKVLLTMMFKSCDLMLAFIRDRNTSQSVIDVFNYLDETLGREMFSQLLPVCLADNGSEFSNPKALEYNTQGDRRTRLYYCDPFSSFQKPNVELNHEFIRKVLPKGRSFDDLTQNDISLMMSHINSYSREKLNDKSPFDMFSFLYGFGILEKLGISRISANEILLKPSLLKK
ncbi:IS30 family transposase [Anaerobacterium chartisolvens]|uniref:IS30 family transposase n=2 Tax=Anaerobacterium chartisolvens TaxID=1297424 RepID=A0A369ACG6_9FIRM|nr:IS30 family transposase [Anaerobacterium chartisolvens]